jgi:hypothetical protein
MNIKKNEKETFSIDNIDIDKLRFICRIFDSIEINLVGNLFITINEYINTNDTQLFKELKNDFFDINLYTTNC